MLLFGVLNKLQTFHFILKQFIILCFWCSGKNHEAKIWLQACSRKIIIQFILITKCFLFHFNFLIFFKLYGPRQGKRWFLWNIQESYLEGLMTKQQRFANLYFARVDTQYRHLLLTQYVAIVCFFFGIINCWINRLSSYSSLSVSFFALHFIGASCLGFTGYVF